MVERITCPESGCGTFVLDDALADRLRRTGEPFTCPAGHTQNFTVTTESKLRERISELEAKLEETRQERDRYQERASDRREQLGDTFRERQEERRKRKDTEATLLEHVDGVVEAHPDHWMWGCRCGSRSQKGYSTEAAARKRFRKHRRDRCEQSASDPDADAGVGDAGNESGNDGEELTQ